ncbi:MAG TPA: YhfC family intramembrane metalloprotease [Jeotgalicoccus sp.]|nr:YhfC family intramembrane metalloprotease [Jeotgalicoccus sp.]
MIPQSEIVIMAAVGVTAVLLPFIFMIILRKKFKIRWLPFILGIGIFLVFALILEQIMHVFVLSPEPDGTIALVSSSPWLYVLYGIFAAGIFEETGRLFAFLLTKKHYRDVDSAVSYGIGHGGFEAAAVVALGMLNGIILAVMINSGSDAISALPIAAEDLVVSQPWYMYLVAIMERVIAMSLHIALSVIVFSAVMMKGKWWLYPLAILLHALANTTAAMMQVGLLTNIYLMYAGLILITAITIFIAVRLVKDYRTNIYSL